MSTVTTDPSVAGSQATPSASLAIARSTSASQRLMSIDALRGFDMFWIVGGDAFIVSVLALIDRPWSKALTLQWEHVEWEGFRFYDLIFPLFLFLVGCVLPFSMEKYRAQPLDAYSRIARRVLLLVGLGLVANGLLKLDFENLRLAGVLQRIGICYGIAALLYLHLNLRALTAVLVAVLLIYWAILALVPVPGGVAGDFTIEGNLGGYLDRNYLPGKIDKAYYGFGDNEGILSTLGAVGTALLGVLSGAWLKSSREPWAKVSGLLLAGTACLLVGVIWSNALPLIKNLWTSSFVLVTGGCSLILLAWFYAVIDVLEYRRWAYFWIVIGMNAITIYMAERFIKFDFMASYFLDGAARLSDAALPGSKKVWLTGGTLAAEWLLLWYLYKQRLFLRV